MRIYFFFSISLRESFQRDQQSEIWVEDLQVGSMDNVSI